MLKYPHDTPLWYLGYISQADGPLKLVKAKRERGKTDMREAQGAMIEGDYSLHFHNFIDKCHLLISCT